MLRAGCAMPELRLSLRPTRLVAAMALMVVVSIGVNVMLNVLVPGTAGVTDFVGVQRAAALKSTIATFAGAMAGAAIAGRGFLWAAWALWAMQWVALVQVMVRMSDVDTLQVLRANNLAIAGTLLATTFGVWTGQQWSRYRARASRDAHDDSGRRTLRKRDEDRR